MEVAMNWNLQMGLGASALLLAGSAMAEITLYEGEGFRGHSLTTGAQLRDLTFSRNRTGSIVVDRGAWEVCEEPDFGGRCVTLKSGSYDSRESIGLDRVLSVRSMRHRNHYENEVPPPMIQPTYEYRQRPHERLYETNVTSVRAVMGPPEQHCWVERQEVVEPHRDGANVGGAIAGALIGGILGHQVGGHNRDAVAAGGAIAGAAIGANAGHGGTTYDRDVQRCEMVPSGPPSYWEVTYNFQGVEHAIQMTDPPGPTITVNQNGEPRQ
jgi:uncharacterized protein YcfJ